MRASKALLIAIAASAVVLAAPAALASTEFGSMDSNNDGTVSSSEHEIYARRMFDLIDTNHDDKVTSDELNAAEGKVPRHASGPTEMNAAARIRRRDANGDGIISQGEQAEAAAQKFIHLDADHNGQLTEQEFASGE